MKISNHRPLSESRRASHLLARLYKEDRPSFSERFIQAQDLFYPGSRESLLKIETLKVELSTYHSSPESHNTLCQQEPDQIIATMPVRIESWVIVPCLQLLILLTWPDARCSLSNLPGRGKRDLGNTRKELSCLWHTMLIDLGESITL